MILPPPFIEPPARYLEIDAPSAVFEVPADSIVLRCALLGVRAPRLEGCALPGQDGRPCTIIIPDARTYEGAPWTRPKLLRHEQAHCNGWPKDHPK